LLEIIVLKKYLYTKNAQNLLENSKSLFVTNNIEIKKNQRCKLSNIKK